MLVRDMCPIPPKTPSTIGVGGEEKVTGQNGKRELLGETKKKEREKREEEKKRKERGTC